jgi:opacity protein-like surface antigen
MIRARRSAGISAALHAAEVFMKKVSLMFSMVALIASPLCAQTERGYVAGEGGFAMTHETTSGDALVEGGIRVAPHLLLFGDLGQFHDVQPSDVQPSVDTTTALLSSAQGLTTIGAGRVPAWYAQSGLRYEIPLAGRITPYALGGLGFARLTPTAQFTFSSGTLPDGTTPTVGTDVTSQITNAGFFTAPPASTAFMYTLGGGIAIPIAPHWAADVGYRFSRIAADTPLNAQGATFGVGYRF